MYHQSNDKPSDWLPTPPASLALKHLSRLSNFRAPVSPHRHDETGDPIGYRVLQRQREKKIRLLRSRLVESLMISPVVKAKPNTKGQFLRASDNATCVKGLPTTGVTMLPKLFSFWNSKIQTQIANSASGEQQLWREKLSLRECTFLAQQCNRSCSEATNQSSIPSRGFFM